MGLLVYFRLGIFVGLSFDCMVDRLRLSCGVWVLLFAFEFEFVLIYFISRLFVSVCASMIFGLFAGADRWLYLLIVLL